MNSPEPDSATITPHGGYQMPTFAAGTAVPEAPRVAETPPVTAHIGRATVTLSEGPGERVGGAATSLRRPGRGPRRASLHIKRVDPWSVLKLSLVLSVALFFVWLVAVGVLYGVLDGMGTWKQLNGAYTDLASTGDGPELISAGSVFGVAALVGAVNIVLFTALTTVGAFIYNVAADLVGGVELTLSERE
ncbi:DUF3566 domain-containing protein [Pseudonocardiaceae bacterium YIM PH 21723]|nr:DUF3566 domain-containing protein [Pseudonocardiaceae bacterium YIM PH 21723]